MAADYDHCAMLVREADRDRYLATLFAPSAQRGALFALYAFNAEIARVHGLVREPMPGEIRLQWWRETLAGERDGEAAAHPVAAALLATLKRYTFSPERLIALIDAHARDLYDAPMARLADLESYGRDTQGTLFSLATGFLGAEMEAVETLARHAGIAAAIMGMLGAFSASRQQFYLPEDMVERHAVDREKIVASPSYDAPAAALAELRGHARHHLAIARAEATTAPAYILPAVLSAACIGPELNRMERFAQEPFRFTPIPSWRRQWLIWRAAHDPSRIFKA